MMAMEQGGIPLQINPTLLALPITSSSGFCRYLGPLLDINIGDRVRVSAAWPFVKEGRVVEQKLGDIELIPNPCFRQAMTIGR